MNEVMSNEDSQMKRCQVCGVMYDLGAPGECRVAFRGRHIPTDRPGTVYVLCFGEPRMVAQADSGHVQPTTHYVGWTGQSVGSRIRQHKVPLESLAHSGSGTADDEQKLKETGTCPRCGIALAPECLGRQGRLMASERPDPDRVQAFLDRWGGSADDIDWAAWERWRDALRDASAVDEDKGPA